jgi:hypothetical protein
MPLSQQEQGPNLSIPYSPLVINPPIPNTTLNPDMKYEELVEIIDKLTDTNEIMIQRIIIMETKLENRGRKDDIVPYLTFILSLLFPLWYLNLLGAVWIVSEDKYTRVMGYLNFVVGLLYLIHIYYDPWWL